MPRLVVERLAVVAARMLRGRESPLPDTTPPGHEKTNVPSALRAFRRAMVGVALTVTCAACAVTSAGQASPDTIKIDGSFLQDPWSCPITAEEASRVTGQELIVAPEGLFTKVQTAGQCTFIPPRRLDRSKPGPGEATVATNIVAGQSISQARMNFTRGETPTSDVPELGQGAFEQEFIGDPLLGSYDWVVYPVGSAVRQVSIYVKTGPDTPGPSSAQLRAMMRRLLSRT